MNNSKQKCHPNEVWQRAKSALKLGTQDATKPRPDLEAARRNLQQSKNLLDEAVQRKAVPKPAERRVTWLKTEQERLETLIVERGISGSHSDW